MLYWVYTGLYSVQISIYRYTTFYPSMKPVYLGIYAYEQEQDRIYAYDRCISAYKSFIYAYIRVCDILQKHSCLSDSKWESHAYCKAALTTMPPALILTGAWYDICLLNWGSSLSLGAFWLMSDVLCWAGSYPAPAMMRGFAKRVSSLSRPGRLWDSLLYLSPSQTPLCSVGLGKITETIHLLLQMCTSHKTRWKIILKWIRLGPLN